MENENINTEVISDLSIEVIVNSIIKESAKMGFKQSDYVKLVNSLLEKALSINNSISNLETNNFNFSDQNNTSFPLLGEKVKIRKIVKNSDEDILKKWMQDEIGKSFLSTRTTKRNYTLNDLIEKKDDYLGVITLHDGRPIGLMAFLDIDYEQHKAEMRKLIGLQEFRGKGLGKEASKLWINFGHLGLNLRKIYINTIEANIRNVRINRDLGFKVEGILRKELFLDDKYFDILRMGLIFE